MTNSSVCFFPDGTTTGLNTSPNFVPCDPEAENSACCALGESCVGKGLCLSQNGLIYRGACTDKTFASGACPSVCIDSSGSFAGTQSNFEFLKPCGTTTGNLTWVCGLSANCSDLTVNFALIVGSIWEVNITGTVATATTSSASITSSTSSSTATSTGSSATSICSSANSSFNASEAATCNDVVVGAGVGVPLGILLILSLIWVFWERRKVGIIKRREVDYAAWGNDGGNGNGAKQMGVSEAFGDTGAQELRGGEGDIETRKFRGEAVGELA